MQKVNRALDTEQFIKDFQPYRGKYTKQFRMEDEAYLFPTSEYEWRTIYKYLKKSYVEKAIAGSIIVGWFTNTRPNIIGIDIDDHSGTAWKGVAPSPQLLSLYDRVLKRFPEPSILVQSPRGLHIYYVLNDRIPSKILEYLAKEKLKGIRCEVRPTPDLSLRIPDGSRLLNPKTLLPSPGRKVEKYHPAILFDDRYLPAIVRETLQDRKSKLRTFLYSPKIERVERLYTPIIPGYSNEALNHLIPVYKGAGLTAEDAIYRFTLILQQSVVYDGELTNPKRLEQRVRSYYRKDYKNYIPEPQVQQLNLLHRPLVEELVNQSPWTYQRDKAIETFLYSLLNWCSWHDEIIQNPKQTAYFDYLYPWYRKNRKAGYYPLPQTFLVKSNQRYFNIMKWLQEIGFISSAPFKYLPKGGICKYYRVNTG